VSTPLTLPVAGCGQDVPRLPVAVARERILDAVAPVRELESVPLRAALQRVLARELVSPIDVPGHTNSAVDGYALAASSLPARGSRVFTIIGTALAGSPCSGKPGPDQCVRIMTGAPLPAGTDTVIMQEHVTRQGDTVRIDEGHRCGQNVRAAGEDLARGAIALEAGKRLTPADLGLAASIGAAELTVYRRVRVAFFSTGDELRAVGEPLEDGAIYDSNRYTLHGMLSMLGVEIIDLGVVQDDRDTIRAAFQEAARSADAIITSGGVSVGDADYVKEILAELGEVGFWQIAMKPGRPLAFGHVGPAAFFGLPGNPVSVMVTFYEFVQPALRRMMGEYPVGEPPTFLARCVGRFRKQPGRTEYQRAIVEHDAGGELIVRPTGSQGSGILHSMSHANCLVVLPDDGGTVETGARVAVQPFFGLMG